MKLHLIFAVLVMVCMFLGRLGYAAVDCQKNAVVQAGNLSSVTSLSYDPNEPDPNKVPE